jgi:hypothetical protein
MDAQPMNSTAPTQMVAIGEAQINPPWQGHLIAIADNGGDLLMLSFDCGKQGMIRCLYPRTVGASIRDWLIMALQQPTLQPVQQPQAVEELPTEAQKN